MIGGELLKFDKTVLLGGNNMIDNKTMLCAIADKHNMEVLEGALDTVNEFLDSGAVIYVKVKGKDGFIKLEKIETRVMIMPFI